MYTEMALATRTFAVTLAVAGIATLGSVALAPAASAAQPVAIVGTDALLTGVGNDNGPDEFLLMKSGRKPVFFCEAGKPQKQAICIDKDKLRGS